MTIQKILYKYRSWQENDNIDDNNKFQKRLLTKSEFYISSPKQFNDPFDLAIPKRYDLMTRDQFLRTSLFHLGTKYPLKTFKEIFLLAKKNTNERYNNPQYKIDLKQNIENFIKTHGVYCFSEEPTNILSWTFYGNNHAGYCVGLDKLRLQDYLEKKYTKAIGLFKVHYTDNFPEIIPDMDVHIRLENVFKRLTIKYINWSYEKEWRLVTPNFSEELIELPKDIYKEVYLGSNTSDSVKNEIIKTLKEKYMNKVNLFELEPNTTEYELDIKRINY